MAATGIPKCVTDIKDCVESLKVSFEDGPVTDDCASLQKFCTKLEYILQIDMTARSGFFGKKDYWDYFYACLHRNKGLNDGLRFVKAMNEVKSSLGRGRALIRYSLVHQRLGDTLQQCISSADITKQWYSDRAVLCKPKLYSVIIESVYELNDVQFDLAPSGSDLDTAWPTFAKNAIGVGLYMWKPPNRTSSMSSLSSQATTADSKGTPVDDTDLSMHEAQLERLQTEMTEYEQTIKDLRQKIEKLETKLATNASMALDSEQRLQGRILELERLKQELDYKASKAVSDGQAAQSEKQQLHTELILAKQDSKRMSNELRERIEMLKMQAETQDAVKQKKEEELRTKLENANERMHGLELQLQAARLEVQHMKDSETKGKSFEALEKRNNDLEQKYQNLQSMLEFTTTSRDQHIGQQMESLNVLKTLLVRLSSMEGDSEAVQKMHQEIHDKVRTIAGSISLKGTPDGEDAKISEHEGGEKDDMQLLEGALKQLQQDKKVGELENVKTQDTLLSFECKETGMSSELKEAITFLENENKKFKKDLNDWQLRGEQMENLIQDQEQKLKERSTQVYQLLQETKGIKEEMACISEFKDHMITDMPFLKEKVGKVVQAEKRHPPEVVIFLQTIKGILQEMETTRSNSKTLEEELEKLSQERDDLAFKSINDDQEVKVLKEERGVHNQKIADLQLSIDTYIAQASALEVELKDSSSKGSRLENLLIDYKKVEDLLKVEEEKNLNLSRKIKELEIQCSELVSQTVILNDDNKAFLEEKGKLRDAIDSAKREMVQLREHSTVIESVLQERSGQVAELEKHNAGLIHEVSVLTDDNKAFLEEKMEMRESVEEKQQRISELEERLQEMEQILLEKEEQVDELVKSISENDDERSQERNNLEETFEIGQNELLQDHENRIVFLKEQFNLVKSELDTMEMEKKELEERTVSLTEESKQRSCKTEEQECEIKELTDSNKALNLEITSMDEKLKLVTAEKDELEERCQTLEEELKIQTEVGESKTETISKLDEALESARDQTGEYLKLIEEKEEATKEALAKVDELEKSVKQAEEKQKNLEGMVNQEISALKFQLGSETLQYQQKLQGYKDVETELNQWREKCSKQEDTLINMTEELNQTKKDLEDEIRKLSSEINMKTSRATNKEEQVQMLEDSLLQVSKQLEDKATLVLMLQEKVTSYEKTEGNKLMQLQHQLQQSEEDNFALKKQVIKFVREKDVLWQRTEKLESIRKMKASERWLADDEVLKCMQCELSFSLTVRKHHCRMCGGIFCSKCAKFTISTSHSKKKLRTCEKCFVSHLHSLEADSLDTSVISMNFSDEDEKFANSRLSLTSESDTTESLSSVADNSAPVPDDPVFPAGCLPLLSESTKEEADSSSVGHDNADISTGDSHPASNGVKQTESGLSPDHRSESEVDPEFDIISEDEVNQARIDDEEQASQVDHVSDPSTTAVLASEILSNKKNSGEVTLWPGYNHSIPVVIEKEGVLLCWQFTSSPKSISFKVTFSDSVSIEPTEELVPLTRCSSHHRAIEGELLSLKPGVYTLHFDNTFSKVTSKIVKYQLAIKHPEAVY